MGQCAPACVVLAESTNESVKFAYWSLQGRDPLATTPKGEPSFVC